MATNAAIANAAMPIGDDKKEMPEPSAPTAPVTPDTTPWMFATIANAAMAAPAAPSTGAIWSKFSISHVMPGTTVPVTNWTALRKGSWNLS